MMKGNNLLSILLYLLSNQNIYFNLSFKHSNTKLKNKAIKAINSIKF